MSTAWVAGTVRARALVNRRVAVATARRVAVQPNVKDAVRVLTQTPYGHDVREGQGLTAAQHAVMATLLWHLRVLAGWLPGQGMVALRALAGGFEIANVEGVMFGEPTFGPGALATALAHPPEGFRPAPRSPLRRGATQVGAMPADPAGHADFLHKDVSL